MTRGGTNQQPGVTNGARVLDASAGTVDSSGMRHSSPQIRLSWIFGVASGLGAFSTLIAFSYKFFFIGTKTPAEAAARERVVDVDLLGRNARRLRGQSQRGVGVLRTDPHIDTIRLHMRDGV